MSVEEWIGYFTGAIFGSVDLWNGGSKEMAWFLLPMGRWKREVFLFWPEPHDGDNEIPADGGNQNSMKMGVI